MGVSEYSRPIRVGFAGVAHPHVLTRARLLLADPRVEVVGFAEKDEVIGEQVEARLALVRYASLPALLGAGIDLAVIEATDPDQLEIAQNCIGEVRAILIEKPGMAQPQWAYDLQRQCQQAGVLVEFGYQLHYADSILRLRKLIASGCLGQITLAHFHGGCPVGSGLDPWQALPEDRGGFAYTIGCHVMEWVIDLFGAPQEVAGLVRKLEPGEVVESPFHVAHLFSPRGPSSMAQVGTCMYEDVAAAMLVYADKLVTVDLTAWEADDWAIRWGIQLYGTNGTAEAGGGERVSVHLRGPRGGYEPGTTSWDTGQPQADYTYRRQLDSLVGRLLGLPREEQVALSTGVGVLKVLDAMFSSAAASGALQPVPRQNSSPLGPS